MKKYFLQLIATIFALSFVTSCSLFTKQGTATNNTTIINQTIEVDNDNSSVDNSQDNSQDNRQTDKSINIDIDVKPSVPSVPNPSKSVKPITKKIKKIF